MTDSLLFDWPELLQITDPIKPEFRFITSQNGIKPSSYTQYAMPKDIADISRDRDINKLADVLSVRHSYFLIINKSNPFLLLLLFLESNAKTN